MMPCGSRSVIHRGPITTPSGWLALCSHAPRISSPNCATRIREGSAWKGAYMIWLRAAVSQFRHVNTQKDRERERETYLRP
jgi:hypothetical protein